MLRILTVGEVARYLRDTLEADPMLADCWIAGEVSNVGRPASGHVYFTLKDQFGQIRCALFRSHALRNPHFEDGDAIIAHGGVSFYEASGQVQFYVDLLQPEGVGRLHLEFLALKVRLEDEGLFDPLRKRAIRRYPSRIALITSPTGAVVHDVCAIVERRFPLTEILVIPASVQGAEAVGSICQAFARVATLDPRPDTVILARGGGSLEDLWPFNEEAVARAVFACPISVITGVGHETDVTISDLVADLRAPTPSAAAELAVPDRAELLSELGYLRERMTIAVTERVDHSHQVALGLTTRLRAILPVVERAEGRLNGAIGRGSNAIAGAFRGVLEAHRSACLRLQALSPLLTLARGFAAVSRSDDGLGITSVRQIEPRALVDVRLHDGAFTSEVKSLCK